MDVVTLAGSSSMTLVPSGLHSFAVEGLVKGRVSSAFGTIYLF